MHKAALKRFIPMFNTIFSAQSPNRKYDDVCTLQMLFAASKNYKKQKFYPLTRGSAPGPRWGLCRVCPQIPVTRSCSALAMGPPTTDPFRRLWFNSLQMPGIDWDSMACGFTLVAVFSFFSYYFLRSVSLIVSGVKSFNFRSDAHVLFKKAYFFELIFNSFLYPMSVASKLFLLNLHSTQRSVRSLQFICGMVCFSLCVILCVLLCVLSLWVPT